MDISRLVEYLAMGTLMGYSMVALAVLHLRYRPTLLNSDGTEVCDRNWGRLEVEYCVCMLAIYLDRLFILPT